MHYKLLLAVKAKTRKGAKRKVDEFLEPYGDGREWDWYEIGGRWSEYGEIVGYGEKGFQKLKNGVELTLKRKTEEYNFLVEILEKGVQNVSKPESTGGIMFSTKEVLYNTASKKEWLPFMMFANEVTESYKGWFHNSIGYYNVEEGGNNIPEEWNGYYIVVVDLHN